MSNDPAVLWYTSDFLTGTTLFNFEQVGQYTRLLCHQHQLGHLPEQHMLDICKSYDNPVFKKFIKDENGLWYNIRMEKEIKKRLSYCESRRSNKMKEYEKPQHMFKHMSEHMDNDNDNENKNVIINEKEKEISEYLKKRIIEIAPDARHTEAQIISWSDSVRLMVERDGRTHESIRTMIDWIFSQPERNGFSWAKVIRSMSTLRQRWNEGKIGEQKIKGENDGRTGRTNEQNGVNQRNFKSSNIEKYKSL